MKTPKISVIIPVFNESTRIEKCLKSIRDQHYPQKQVEILIIDDNSTDQTVNLAKKYNVRVLINGTHHIERAKSIGVQNAKSELLFFMDADNTLTTSSWFKDCVDIFNHSPKVIGVQSAKFLYRKQDNLANKYCALFGINDPFIFYLKKRGLLMETEEEWIYPETLIKDYPNFFLVKFNKVNLPTLGSQGYMTKKSMVLKSNWQPYLFHMDSIYDLVKESEQMFAIIKYEIEHDYATSSFNMFSKWKRNIELFFKYQKERRYKYDLSITNFILVMILMLTVIVPLKDSIKGYVSKQDIAWFMHPIYCIIIVAIYTYYTIEHYFKKFFGR